MGPAGVLLTSVVLEKTTQGRRFVVVDAGMSDFLRPRFVRGNPPHRTGDKTFGSGVADPVRRCGAAVRNRGQPGI